MPFATTVTCSEFRKKLKSFNCYWLNEPNKAISTMSNTLTDTSELLGDLLDDDTVPFNLQEWIASLSKLASEISCWDANSDSDKSEAVMNAATKHLSAFLKNPDNVCKMKKVAYNVYNMQLHL